MESVTVGLLQMSCGPQPEANLAKALERVRQAAAQGAQIVCLQELFRTRYFCQTEDDRNFALAEAIPGPTTAALSHAAAANHVVLIGPVFERRADGLYHNSAAVFDCDGRLLGVYRKMHIPDDPRYYEKFYFTPGDAEPGFRAFNSARGTLGVLICWDQWFPEAARLTALAGARLIFYPTAIGWHRRERPEMKRAQAEAWELAQRAHALANGCFVCAANRVGREGGLEFWGGSIVADPFGRIIAKAGADEEALVLARCDLGLIDQTRRQWPFLRDRRIDAYQDIVRRYRD